jgi:hypothetical protein
VLWVDTAAPSGTATAAATKTPAISRFRLDITLPLHMDPDSPNTITCLAYLRSKVVAAGLLEQTAPIGLHRHQITE